MSDFIRKMQDAARARRVAPAVPQAPRVPTFRDPLMASPQDRLRERMGLAPLAVTESAAEGLEVPGPVMGALRRVASALEPLALPQDAFFAALAGATDPDTTITQRLQRIQPRDYLPGGEAPERPATGEEILSFMGFDEQVAKWAGLGADLLVDPLVFGSWLRVAGKLGRVDELVRLGDRVDTFVSPLGMARETNALLRRSSAISAWQDARMERVLRAFRDPDSVVFGIQRFGERATRTLDTVMPRDTMLRLRFGEETGRQLLKAEQTARAAGARISHELLTLIQRAKYGPTGDTSQELVQNIVRTMEEQTASWERHLSSISDRRERDFIETAVYAITARQTARQLGDPNLQRASFMTEMTPEKLGGEAMSNFYGEATEALGRFEDFGFDADTARRLGYDPQELGERIVDTRRVSVEEEKTILRERLRGYVGERARRQGFSDERIVDEQRRAVHVFDSYLEETIGIDAKLGMELSGFPFISKRLRERTFELTGSFEKADEVYMRTLNAGLTRGQAGIDELMGESTGIMLRGDHMLPDTAARMERYRAMYSAADNLLNRLKVMDNAFARKLDAVKAQRELDRVVYQRNRERLNTLVEVSEEQWNKRLSSIAAGRRSVLMNGTDDMEEYARIYASRFRELWKNIENYTSPGRGDMRGVKRRLLRNVATIEDRIERYAMEIARVANAPPDKLNRQLLSGVIRQERQLIAAFKRQSALFDETIQAIGVRPRPTPVRTVTTSTEEIAGEGQTLYRLKVPKKFYDDHLERDLPGGKVTRTLSREYEIELTPDEYAELMNDAQFYVDKLAQDLTDPYEKATALGMLSSARATIKRLEGAQPVSQAGPSTVRAVREVGREARDPRLTPRAAAGTDAELAEEMFEGPADLYWELNHLRTMADELRLDLEDALTSKVTVPREFQMAADDVTEQSQRLRSEVAQHRRTIQATAAEKRQARAAEAETIRNERNKWFAAEAAEAGVKKAGGRAHILKEMQKARKEYGIIPQAEPTDAMPISGAHTTLEDIKAARIHNAERRSEHVDIDEILAEPVTFEELFGGIHEMQALHLGDFLEGIMSGHMRRAFGLFIDENGFARYLDKLTGGGIIASNVLDEDNILANLTGFEREAGLIRDYHNALKAAGGGHVLKRDGIVEYLMDQGVSGGRINQVLAALHESVTRSERQKSNIRTIRDYIGSYSAQRQSIQAGIGADSTALKVRNRQLFAEQEELNKQVLEILGDYSMASMSLLEGAQLANRVLPRQRYFEEALKVATDRGLVKGAQFTDKYGAVYRKVGDADGAIGGFGGRYVHPYLYAELQRMAAVKQNFLPAAFTRFRALVTGGYLASPAVLAANVSGGYYQAATAGFHPVAMSRRIGEVIPEFRKGARGEHSDLLEEVDKHLKLDVTTLMGNSDIEDVGRAIRIEAGVGAEGVRGFLDNAATEWERFLQRPFGIRWAGLEGFQLTENLFKVAAYKEMKERVLRHGVRGPDGRYVRVGELRAQEIAAEAARTVVFDYSTLPTSLDALKRTGLILFPGFPFFIAGRTVAATLERPGTVAMADRIAEALANASLSIEEQAALFMGSPEWLRGEQGTPLPGAVIEREDGSRQVSVIPMSQLVPTTTVWDSVLSGQWDSASNPWGESLIQLGMWGPLYDIISAIATGTGEAPISGRYGHVVFEQGTTGSEKAAHMFRFLYNTMAPSAIRKGLSIDYQERAQGLIPSLIRAFTDRGDTSPDDLLAGVYSIEERRTGRPDRTWREGIISTFLRTPQVVALDGPLAGIRNEMAVERTQLNEQISALKRRYNRARAAGQTATSEQLLARMNTIRDEFNARWSEFLDFYNAYAQRQRQQGQ